MTQKIIYMQDDGVVAIITPTSGVSIEEVVAKDVPRGRFCQIVNDDEIPSDRTFRNAWIQDASRKVTVDIQKAKEIAHSCRRDERAKAFAPLDVAANVPHLAVQAERDRSRIREIDASKQIAIDTAIDVVALKTALSIDVMAL